MLSKTDKIMVRGAPFFNAGEGVNRSSGAAVGEPRYECRGFAALASRTDVTIVFLLHEVTLLWRFGFMSSPKRHIVIAIHGPKTP